jgi:hypothetical protein
MRTEVVTVSSCSVGQEWSEALFFVCGAESSKEGFCLAALSSVSIAAHR